MNLVAIASACAVECERQQVGLYELSYLIGAYRYVIQDGMGPDNIDLIGRVVEPEKNRFGYRITPVTFRNGGTAAGPQEIDRLMATLGKTIQEFVTEGHDLNEGLRQSLIDFIVKQFLWIHPFADGNGRTAFLLLNYLSGTMDDPKPLPDYFGEK